MDERLKDINETLMTIREATAPVSNKADAEDAADTIRRWLDTLDSEIERLDE